MKKNLLILLLLTFNILSAQPFMLSWERTFNDSLTPFFQTVTGSFATADGDFWVAGRRDSVALQKVSVCKYSSGGNLLIEKNYFALSPDIILCDMLTTDLHGNFYLGGRYLDGTNGNFLIMKFDSIGDLVWQFSYDGIFNGQDFVNEIKTDSLDNIYIAGRSYISPTDSKAKAFVLKVNAGGTLDWIENTDIEVYSYDKIHLVPVSDNRINLFCSDSNNDLYLCAFDANGLLYKNLLESNFSDFGFAYDGNKNAIFSAHFNSDYRMVSIDTSGQIIWDTQTNNTSFDHLIVDQYIYAAYSFGYNSVDLYKLNLSGGIEWSIIYTGAVTELIYPIILSKVQGNLIMALFVRIAQTQFDTRLLEFDDNGTLIHTNNYNLCTGASTPASACSNSAGNYFLSVITSCPYSVNREGIIGSDTTLQYNFIKVRENLQNGYESSAGIVIDSNGNPVVAVSKNDSTGSATISILKFSPTGNLLSTIPVINSDYIQFRLKNFSIDNFGNYILSGTCRRNQDNNDNPTVFKISPAGQVIFRYIYTNDVYAQYKLSHMTDENGNVYLSGPYNINLTDTTHAFLLKLNSQGDTVWTKILSYSGNRNSPSNLIIDNNSIYLLQSVIPNSGGDFYFTEFDTSGNLISNNLLNGPNGGNLSNGLLSRDNAGNFISYGQRLDTTINGLPNYSWYIVKHDSIGNIFWDNKVSGHERISDKPMGMVVDESRNIYVTGTYNYSGVSGNGLTVRYNENGNIAWQDSIDNYVPESIHYLNGLIYLSGYNLSTQVNYVILYDTLGQILYEDSISGPVQHASIKTFITADSSAMYFAGTVYTDSTVRDMVLRKYSNLLTSVEGKNLPVENSVNLYPNPAKKYFTIELTEFDNQKAILILTDNSGKIVLQKEIESYKTVIEVGSLSNGIYFGTIFEENQKPELTFRVNVVK